MGLPCKPVYLSLHVDQYLDDLVVTYLPPHRLSDNFSSLTLSTCVEVLFRIPFGAAGGGG